MYFVLLWPGRSFSPLPVRLLKPNDSGWVLKYLFSSRYTEGNVEGLFSVFYVGPLVRSLLPHSKTFDVGGCKPWTVKVKSKTVVSRPRVLVFPDVLTGVFVVPTLPTLPTQSETSVQTSLSRTRFFTPTKVNYVTLLCHIGTTPLLPLIHLNYSRSKMCLRTLRDCMLV